MEALNPRRKVGVKFQAKGQGVGHFRLEVGIAAQEGAAIIGRASRNFPIFRGRDAGLGASRQAGYRRGA